MTTRRTLLAAGAATAVTTLGISAPARAATRSAATRAEADLVGGDAIAHLLRRATFGPTPASLAEAGRLGAARWLDRQLDPAAIDDSRAEGVLARLPLAGAGIAAVRSAIQIGRASCRERV